jgi:hypothetical protein
MKVVVVAVDHSDPFLLAAELKPRGGEVLILRQKLDHRRSHGTYQHPFPRSLQCLATLAKNEGLRVPMP